MFSMTKPFPPFFCAALFVLLITGLPDESMPAGPTSQPAPPLEQIMNLLKGTWEGEITDSDGNTLRSRLTFTWTLNRKFIKAQHVITSGGESQLYAETLYGRHPVLQRVMFWTFDNAGGVHEGSVTLEGRTLHYEWRSFEGHGEIRDQRSRFQVHADGTATLSLLEPQQGDWVEGQTITYARKSE